MPVENLGVGGTLVDKSAWEDPEIVARSMREDPADLHFRETHTQFLRSVVKPAKVTQFLASLFQGELRKSR